MNKIKLIAALDCTGLIGNKGGLPWYIKEDLRHFASLTRGHCVIMGRKTSESFANPLPNRVNYVVSSQPNKRLAEENIVWAGLEQCIADATVRFPDKDIFIIGGATIYKMALELDLVDEMILTLVKHQHVGDTYFPDDVVDMNRWEPTSLKRLCDDASVYTLERKKTVYDKV